MDLRDCRPHGACESRPQGRLISRADWVLSIWLTEVPDYSGTFCNLYIIASIINALATPLWISIFATGKIRNYQMAAGSGPHLAPNKGLLIHPEVPFYWRQGQGSAYYAHIRCIFCIFYICFQGGCQFSVFCIKLTRLRRSKWAFLSYSAADWLLADSIYGISATEGGFSYTFIYISCQFP